MSLFNIVFAIVSAASLFAINSLAFGETIVSIEGSVKESIEQSVEYEYYQISPRSVHEIKPELMRRSPIRSGGSSFNGHTDWSVNWHFQTAPVRTATGQLYCRLYNIKTKVHVRHILPALSRSVTDKQTIDVFNRFSAALTQHELNHGNNGFLPHEKFISS